MNETLFEYILDDINENRHLKEDTTGALAQGIEKFLIDHKVERYFNAINKAQNLKQKVYYWEQFLKECSKPFSGWARDRFLRAKQDHFKGIMDSYGNDLGSDIEKIYKWVEYSATPKLPRLRWLLHWAVGNQKIKPGVALVKQMITVYTTGNETRGGAASDACHIAHLVQTEKSGPFIGKTV